MSDSIQQLAAGISRCKDEEEFRRGQDRLFEAMIGGGYMTKDEAPFSYIDDQVQGDDGEVIVRVNDETGQRRILQVSQENGAIEAVTIVQL